MSAIYTGPQCPKCLAPLTPEVIRAGRMQCPTCFFAFEATPFQPREHRHERVQVIAETPDGAAAACANHAGNAAVTSCTRCGLFICALCDMNTGARSVCPSCFDRAHTAVAQNDGATRYRDYATMSISAAVIGIVCAMIPAGPFAIWWAIRGIKQRRAEGAGIAGMIIVIIIGTLSTAATLGWYGLMLYGMLDAATSTPTTPP